MPSAVLISRVLAGLLVLVLLVHWRLLPMLFSPVGAVLVGVVLLFLGLLVASIAGLWQVRVWGFVALYLLVPVSTVLHGISLVPLLPRLLPLEWRFSAVMILNGAVFVAAIIAHTRHRRAVVERSATALPKEPRRGGSRKGRPRGGR